MSKSLLVFVSIGLAVSPAVKGAEHWIRLATPHFEMYTTNSEKQGTGALGVFEQVRYFFLQNSHSKSAPDTPARIIAFRSEKEYKPYRTNEGAFAYYLKSRKVDYIVMQDISSEHYQAAVHEYTHLIVEHLGLKLPVWLNEGLADLYSSIEPKGNQALVGRPLAGRASVLASQRWIDLNTLFAVNPESPYYNERDKMSIFYAQSWALTHMLELGNAYRPNFSKFLAAIAVGRPAADCFQSVYGKTLADVDRDLHSYLNQFSVKGALFDVKLSKAELEPELTEPSDLEVNLALADLLAAQKKTAAEASARLSKLAQEHSESAEVEESLGYLAWQQGDAAKARDDFKLAIDRGSKNPEMMVHYTQLLHDSGAPSDQIVPILQRAVAIKPDYQDAWLNLGLMALSSHQPGVALGALLHIKTVSEERAFTLFSAQAYCYMELKAPGEARDAALKAQQYAKSREQELQASNILRSLDAPNKKRAVEDSPAVSSATTPLTPAPAPDRPTGSSSQELPPDVPSVHWAGDIEHVEGTAKSFECGAKPRLHVTVKGEEKIFQLDNPESVVVRNGKDGVFDMQCGAQKPFKVGIFYVPSAPGAAVSGAVRELVF